jgi:hypothetical protein
VTEAELFEAGLGQGPASGVPLDVHLELRELRETVERLGLALAVVRELCELIAAELEVRRAALECDDCGRVDGTHADVEH